MPMMDVIQAEYNKTIYAMRMCISTYLCIKYIKVVQFLNTYSKTELPVFFTLHFSFAAFIEHAINKKSTGRMAIPAE